MTAHATQVERDREEIRTLRSLIAQAYQGIDDQLVEQRRALMRRKYGFIMAQLDKLRRDTTHCNGPIVPGYGRAFIRRINVKCIGGIERQDDFAASVYIDRSGEVYIRSYALGGLQGYLVPVRSTIMSESLTRMTLARVVLLVRPYATSTVHR